jgi:L-ascorbate metabolism protein UlaG (beta-lactamase superfamily)
MALNRDVTITWLGHATFMIDTPGGKRIVIDPFLEGNPACPPHLKQIDRCDLILVTHGHGDHVADALPLSQRTGAPVVAMVELADWLRAKGVQKAIDMNKGGTVRVGEIAVTMVNAFHSCPIEDGDKVLYGGEPAGYVVQLENGFTFYHAGDTDVFGDMALIAELYGPELVMIPIGDHYTMGPKQAAKAVRLLGAKHVVPMHYGTFPVLTGRPSHVKELTGDIEGLVIYDISPGDTIR